MLLLRKAVRGKKEILGHYEIGRLGDESICKRATISIREGLGQAIPKPLPRKASVFPRTLCIYIYIEIFIHLLLY